MVRIGGGVFPHIKEPDYLVSCDILAILYYIYRYGKIFTSSSPAQGWCGSFNSHHPQKQDPPYIKSPEEVLQEKILYI